MRAGVIGRADRLVPRMLAAGLEPVVHAGAQGAPAGAATTVAEYAGFFDALEHQRLFLLDLDPGPDVDRLVDEFYVVMEPGDVVLDLTGSYWGDTLRRYRRMRHRSLFYVDAAFVEGAGASALLASGDARGVELARPAARAPRWQGPLRPRRRGRGRPLRPHAPRRLAHRAHPGRERGPPGARGLPQPRRA